DHDRDGFRRDFVDERHHDHGPARFADRGISAVGRTQLPPRWLRSTSRRRRASEFAPGHRRRPMPLSTDPAPPRPPATRPDPIRPHATVEPTAAAESTLRPGNRLHARLSTHWTTVIPE